MIERVDQIVISASPGDAITSMALSLRDSLRREFGMSEIFALSVAPPLAHEVRLLHELPPTSRANVILYHSSYGEPAVTDALLQRKERLFMVYHNLTPSRFFMRHSAQFAAGVQWGRYELELLRGRFSKVLAVSQYNARDLAENGYEDIEVLGLGLKPSRLASLPTDLTLLRHVQGRFPDGYVVVVAQQLPHKRIDTVIHAMHLVRWVHALELGLVVIGPERLSLYSEALKRTAAKVRLANYWFTGAVEDRSLATLLRASTMLVSASEHEGLSIPPLEAMASCVPVVARGAGAIPDTVDGCAVVLPECAGPALFAEAIVEVANNPTLRADLIARGITRVAEVERQDPTPRLIDMIRDLD